MVMTDLKKRGIGVSPKEGAGWVRGISVSIGVFGLVGILVVGGLSFFFQATPILSEGGMRQTAAIVFQGAYALMRHGANREGIEAALTEMAATRPGMIVRLHRGGAMVRTNGEEDESTVEEGDHYASDPLLQQAATTGEETLHRGNETSRFLFPIRVQQECIACHVGATVGEIGGVLDITYPRAVWGSAVETILHIMGICAVFFVLGMYMKHRKTLTRHRQPHRIF